MDYSVSIPKVSIKQVKAARALLGWSQSDLAESSSVSLPTIKRLEAAGGELGGREETACAIRAALEAAGVVFEDGGVGWSGEAYARRYLADHPEIEMQFSEKRRFWIPSLPRARVGDFTKVFSEHFGCELTVHEIQPAFEFVFADAETDRNSYDELLEIARARFERF